MAMFFPIQLDRDNKIKHFDRKVTSIQSTTTALEKDISDKESSDHQVSNLQDEVSSLEARIKAQETPTQLPSTPLPARSIPTIKYGRRDALVLSGPLVPEGSDRKDYKQIIQLRLRGHTHLNLNISDISTAHRIEKTSPGIDKRNTSFKLCRRDLLQEFFATLTNLNPSKVLANKTESKVDFQWFITNLKKQEIVKIRELLPFSTIVYICRHWD